MGSFQIEDRYKEINARLRRLLADERKTLTLVRANYATELRCRTELEMLLRQCVDDVRREIAIKAVAASRASSKGGGGIGGGLKSTEQALNSPWTAGIDVSVSAFTQVDRERTLEILLSQEKVVSLLYTKAFPIATITPTNHNKKILLHSSNQGNNVDPTILNNLASNGGNITITDEVNSGFHHNKKSHNETHDDDLSVTEGGGGPLIAAALNKLPIIR